MVDSHSIVADHHGRGKRELWWVLNCPLHALTLEAMCRTELTGYKRDMAPSNHKRAKKGNPTPGLERRKQEVLE